MKQRKKERNVMTTNIHVKAFFCARYKRTECLSQRPSALSPKNGQTTSNVFLLHNKSSLSKAHLLFESYLAVNLSYTCDAVPWTLILRNQLSLVKLKTRGCTACAGLIPCTAWRESWLVMVSRPDSSSRSTLLARQSGRHLSSLQSKSQRWFGAHAAQPEVFSGMSRAM